jgi:acyl-CoA synthetase (AMP-forming)/AMP-acid ligase II
MPVTFTTTGTTGIAKSFVLSDELLAARVDRLTVAKGSVFPSSKSIFCDLPPKVNSGLLYELWAAKNGARFFSSGGGTMASALALFESANIDCIVGNTGGLMNYAQAQGPHRFRCIIALGTPTAPWQAGTITSMLGTDDNSLSISYGTQEVGAIATATAAQSKSANGCVGPLCPDVQIEIEDGLIKVKTVTMISGYTDPTLTAKYFKDGWFIPGDYGHLTADSMLVLEPRGARGMMQ